MRVAGCVCALALDRCAVVASVIACCFCTATATPGRHRFEYLALLIWSISLLVAGLFGGGRAHLVDVSWEAKCGTGARG